MAKKLPELSKAEWIIMKTCWGREKSTARQIYDDIVNEKKWDYQTVKTMLDRLTKKGYLEREKLGPLCLYNAKAIKNNIVSNAIDSFIETVLDNTLTPIFAHLAKGKKLKQNEIANLKKLINEHYEQEEK